jgi:hypothetical protein
MSLNDNINSVTNLYNRPSDVTKYKFRLPETQTE